MKQSNPKRAARRTTRIMQLISAGVLALAILCGSVLLLVLQRPTVSELERRELATLPKFSLQTLLSGDFSAGVSAYYEDAVPGRDNLSKLSASFIETFGIRLSEVKFHGVIAPVVQEQVIPSETTAVTETTAPGTESSGDTAADTTAEPPVTTEDTADQTTSTSATGTEIGDEGIITNGILVIRARAIMLYGGGYQTAQSYADTLNQYAASFGGAKVYSMYIPTAVTYYLPQRYASYSYSQVDHAAYIRGQLQGAMDVNIFDALGKHKEEPIYLRTDHHWAPLGAYYAAEVFAAQAGVPFLPLSSYQKVSLDGYVGTMYAFTEDTTLTDNPETFVYYKAQNAYSTEYFNTDMSGQRAGSLFYDVGVAGAYCSFLGTDNIIAHISTDAGNGRKLCIIKDSYGNALVPFLTGSFSDIWVVDMRYFDLNIKNFVQEQGITDVLVAACGFTCCGSNQANLGRILYN